MQLKQYLVAFTLASSSVLALPTEVQGGACVRGLEYVPCLTLLASNVS